MNPKSKTQFLFPGSRALLSAALATRIKGSPLRHLALALALGAGPGAGSAQAQTILEVGGAATITDQALATAQVPAGGVNWTAAGGNGNTFSSLSSPSALVGSTGNVTLTFTHRYNFETDVNGNWDGGAVFVSVNGGSFTKVPLSSFTSNGYSGTALASVWTLGEEIFAGQSTDWGVPTLITSVADLGSLTAADTVAVEFRGGWDGNTFPVSPNWEIGTVQISDTSGSLLNANFAVNGKSGFTASTTGNGASPWKYLQPVSRFEINATAGTADRYAPVTVGSVIDLNGANIEVVRIAGIFTPNQIFALFDLSGGTTLTGTLGSISLPPGTWDTTNLATNGTIKIVTPPPTKIDEPFAYAVGGLNGTTAGSSTGVSGNWTASTNTTLNNRTLSYGSLAFSGKQLSVPSGNSASANVGSTLSYAGLLGNGTTLWFSFVVNSDENSATNEQASFALGTASVGTGSLMPMASSGNGVGVSWDRSSRVHATQWTAGTRAALNAATTLGNTKPTTLIVGSIEWGADDLANETITIYLPGTNLAQPAASEASYSISAKTQSAFNIVSFGFRGDAGKADLIDEIRFGPSYASVIPADATPPILVSTTPVDNDANASSALLQATFDDPVAVGTGDIRIVNDSDIVTTIIPVGDPQVTVAGFSLTITPTVPLLVGKNYHIEMDAGVVTSTSSTLPFAGIADSTTWNFTVDNTLPTLTSIVDNVNGLYPFLGYPVGGPIYAVGDYTLTYTVTFNEPMKASSIDITDFENAGSPTATINSVTPTTNPAIYTVVVSPGGAGALQLRIKAGATLNDTSGNTLNTAAPLPDDTIITVNSGANPIIALDGFDRMPSTTHISSAANSPFTNWETVTGRYKPTYLGGTPAASADNVLPDQTGTDGSGGTTLKGVRVRSTNGAMCLKRPMLLTSANAATVTIQFDLKEVTAGYRLDLQYSKLGDFTDAVTIDNFWGAGTLNTWVHKSYTLTNGSGGVVFSDTAQFMIRKASGGTGGANTTYHTFDNISITRAAAGGYSSWAALNSAGANLDDDHDNDGADNGIEYFRGGPAGLTTGFTALPGVISTLGTLSTTWLKGAGYLGVYGTNFVVETSTTLSGVWTVETLGGGNITDTGTEVKYTFPGPLSGKNFARLKVTGP